MKLRKSRSPEPRETLLERLEEAITEQVRLAEQFRITERIRTAAAAIEVLPKEQES